MKAPLIHVASMIFNEPLAILPKKLDAILAAIGSRLVVNNSALDELLHVRAIHARPILLDDAVLFNAQMTEQNGNRQDEKPYRLTPEGIAVIPIRGTLMKRFSWISAASGCSSYAGLQQAATAALADPQVKGVLFDVDSPGGTTHGCFELSDALYQMRGDKPMWAIANDLAASAAYALASAADRVLVTRTAGVGSIGVFALHADQSGADEQAGVKYTYVFAGDKKTDGNPHEALSKSARADIQANPPLCDPRPHAGPPV
jgi:ClpP class serine protease